MAVKVALIVALALAATVAVYVTVERQQYRHHAVDTNVTFVGTDNESHYVPNFVLMYHSYKHQNNLKFGAAEDEKRFGVFMNNYKKVAAHNAQNSTYKLRMTSLAHLTREEFAAIKLGLANPATSIAKENVVPLKAENLTEEVDWVSKGAVVDVKNQGQCGSCWAFSTIGALEGLNYIKNNKLVSLSEQELVDCSSKYGNQGCNGGLMDQGFAYVADHGVATEQDYPYSGTDGNCVAKTKVFKNTGHQDVKPNDPAQLKAAIANQPVSVAIEADTDAFQFYSSGVLTGDACGTQLDHGVLAVGYGTQDGQGYFKVKNSWGANWGLNGYILIGQASGAGVCGINSDASYPTL